MDTILESYKGDRSTVIQALQDTQKAYGYISQEHLKQISANLGTPYSYAYAIATFYKSFSLQERGKYIISVCDGTACHLKLSEELFDEIQQHLGIGIDETTEDQLFTLEQVNCLGACAMAPVLSINGTLHGNLTRKTLRTFLHQLRQTTDSPETAKVLSSVSDSEVDSGSIAEKPAVPSYKKSSAIYSILKSFKHLIDKLSTHLGHILEE